jgi:hypothetical protein
VACLPLPPPPPFQLNSKSFAPCGCSVVEMVVGFLARVVLIVAAISRAGVVSTLYMVVALVASVYSPILVSGCPSHCCWNVCCWALQAACAESVCLCCGPCVRQPLPWHHVRGTTGGHMLWSLVAAVIAGAAICLQIAYKSRVAAGTAGNLEIWRIFGFQHLTATGSVVRVAYPLRGPQGHVRFSVAQWCLFRDGAHLGNACRLGRRRRCCALGWGLQVGVVIQDVAVIVAAVVHAVVVKQSAGSCEPARLTSAAFMALKTPVTTRFPAYAAAAVISMFAVCVFVPSMIGVRPSGGTMMHAPPPLSTLFAHPRLPCLQCPPPPIPLSFIPLSP